MGGPGRFRLPPSKEGCPVYRQFLDRKLFTSAFHRARVSGSTWHHTYSLDMDVNQPECSDCVKKWVWLPKPALRRQYNYVIFHSLVSTRPYATGIGAHGSHQIGTRQLRTRAHLLSGPSQLEGNPLY